MTWIELNEVDQLERLTGESCTKPVVIFKHSTSCSTSRVALDRLERNWQSEDIPGVYTYFVDVRANRAVSQAVALRFGIPHESPQILIIENGESVYDRSHYDISYQDLKKVLRPIKAA
jgi:monothiol bacilliredoxin